MEFKGSIMKRGLIYLFILIICIITTLLYTNTLYFKLRRFINGQDAQIGIAIIKDDKLLVMENKTYPLLSVFKYLVALKVLNKLDYENIPLTQLITVEKNMVDETLYSPMLNQYKSYPFVISIKDLLEYTISQSDNNACDILIKYTGGIQEVEKFIHDLGFYNIKLSVNEQEMNKNIEKQYLNKASPADIAKLMKFVHEGNILSKNSVLFLDEIMIKSNTGMDKLKGGIPDGVIIGHKTGSSSRKKDGIKIADNDAGFVILPNGTTYYITVLIKDSKMSDSTNAQIIKTISQITYEYFMR